MLTGWGLCWGIVNEYLLVWYNNIDISVMFSLVFVLLYETIFCIIIPFLS